MSIHSTQQERRMTIPPKQAMNTEQEAACSIAELTAANPKDAEEAMGPITEKLSWRQKAPESWIPGQTPLGPSFRPD